MWLPATTPATAGRDVLDAADVEPVAHQPVQRAEDPDHHPVGEVGSRHAAQATRTGARRQSGLGAESTTSVVTVVTDVGSPAATPGMMGKSGLRDWSPMY